MIVYCGDGSETKAHRGSNKSVTMSELEEISKDTKAKEQSALLMGGPRQVDAMGDSGLVLAYVNYDKIIMNN